MRRTLMLALAALSIPGGMAFGQTRSSDATGQPARPDAATPAREAPTAPGLTPPPSAPVQGIDIVPGQAPTTAETAPPTRVTTPAPPAGARRGLDERLFAAAACASSLSEIESAGLTLLNSTSEEVRRFARQMMDDHKRINDRLASLATSKHMTLPANMDIKDQAAIDSLAGLTGADFDREYLQCQRRSHEGAIALFLSEAERGQDPDLRTSAAQMVPALRAHGRMAQNLLGPVGGEGTAATPRDEGVIRSATGDRTPAAGTSPLAPLFGPRTGAAGTGGRPAAPAAPAAPASPAPEDVAPAPGPGGSAGTGSGAPGTILRPVTGAGGSTTGSSNAGDATPAPDTSGSGPGGASGGGSTPP